MHGIIFAAEQRRRTKLNKHILPKMLILGRIKFFKLFCKKNLTKTNLCDTISKYEINMVCARSSVDRVPGYEPVGRRFESCRARHLIVTRV